MNEPLLLVDKDGDTLRIYEKSGVIYTDEGFLFTEESCVSAINSLIRMLDNIICETARGQATNKHPA